MTWDEVALLFAKPPAMISQPSPTNGSVLVDHTFSKTYQFHTTAFNGDYTYFTVLNKQIGAPMNTRAGII